MADKIDPLPDPVSYHELDRILLLSCRFVSYRLRFHKRVASTSRLAATWIFVSLSILNKYIIFVLHKFIPERYTDADPYKRIHIDPSAIEYTTGNKGSKRRGWVVGDNWDQSGNKFIDRTSATAIEQRFVNAMSWDETVLAERYDEREFERRRDSINHLYESIQKNGYESQRRLLEEHPNAAWSDLNDSIHPLANEISVDIGRNGELLWNMCGQHRLAIAKVLDIDRIPVQVFRRHKQWQTIRNKVRNGEDIPEGFLDHPDLDDLLNRDQS